MTLSFTAINRHIQFRNFSCQLADLDVALDILSKITAQGSRILTAYVIDEGNRLELSAEAFDGEPFAEPIHQLEKQWQAVLSNPLRSATLTDNWRIDFTQHQIRIFDQRIAHLLLLIDRLEQFRKRVEATHGEQQKNKLILYYNTSISMYRQYADRARASQQIAQKKLARLQA